MMRFLLSAVVCTLALTSCGPLDGGDPLDGPPGTEGPSLKIRDTANSSGTTGSLGVDSRYDRY